ncbi:MAG TPA: GNAT family N-acetyltransferase [Thermoleophilaceae bacterium]|jgi:CelD/BcsL family acetyltransferase involved in cellulose biosynthesis|nr:GNAT family N-acetyltransferase [Thermoleophilaceae bacterium]
MTVAVPAELEALRDDWSRLAEASGNLFLTWEYAAAWWRHFGAGREPVIGTVRRDGELVALVPLHRGGGAVRTLRFIAAGVADQVGVVSARSELPAAAAELQRLRSEVPHDLFLAERLGGAEKWPALLDAEPRVHEASPVLKLETTDWGEFLAARSRNFRSQAGKYERRLVRDHDLSYRLCSDAGDVDDYVDLVFDLHVRRWGKGTTEFQSEPHRSFHREFAHAAFERGWLRIWIADLDGRPSAAWYGFRFGGTDWSYQSGRDPAYEAGSIGWVLTLHAIRESVQDGMRAYRFLLGQESYKTRFTIDDHGLDSFVIPRTARGHAGHFATRARGRLARWAGRG